MERNIRAVLYQTCPDRVVDILEACGALDLGSNPSRGAKFFERPSENLFPKKVFLTLDMRSSPKGILKAMFLRGRRGNFFTKSSPVR